MLAINLAIALVAVANFPRFDFDSIAVYQCASLRAGFMMAKQQEIEPQELFAHIPRYLITSASFGSDHLQTRQL